MTELSRRWIEYYDGPDDQLRARFDVANGLVLEMPMGVRAVPENIKLRLRLEYGEQIKEAERLASQKQGAQATVDVPIELPVGTPR